MAGNGPPSSWLLLDREDPRWRLPDDLRARDPAGARDVGWVEQMRPFVAQFSRPGETVLDPYAGFGTTLLAAHLEGRQAIGCEIDPARAALAIERLQRHGIDAALHVGTLPPCDGPPGIDLCLTSLPYFGAGADAIDEQLYACTAYAQYLDSVAAQFHRIRDHLRPGRYCIVMVENVRIGGRCVPQAWDVAARLAGMYELCDERVLVYRREPRPSAPLSPLTDRSHEYALVLRRAHQPHAIDATTTWLRALVAAGFEFALYGSFATWWRDRSAPLPADADLLVHPDADRLNALLGWLHERHYTLHSWGEPVALPLQFERYADRRYFRARRLDADGTAVQLDLGYAVDDGDVATAIAQREWVDGLPLLPMQRRDGVRS